MVRCRELTLGESMLSKKETKKLKDKTMKRTYTEVIEILSDMINDRDLIVTDCANNYEEEFNSMSEKRRNELYALVFAKSVISSLADQKDWRKNDL